MNSLRMQMSEGVDGVWIKIQELVLMMITYFTSRSQRQLTTSPAHHELVFLQVNYACRLRNYLPNDLKPTWVVRKVINFVYFYLVYMKI
jgi:hypothetical protein